MNNLHVQISQQPLFAVIFPAAVKYMRCEWKCVLFQLRMVFKSRVWRVCVWNFFVFFYGFLLILSSAQSQGNVWKSRFLVSTMWMAFGIVQLFTTQVNLLQCGNPQVMQIRRGLHGGVLVNPGSIPAEFLCFPHVWIHYMCSTDSHNPKKCITG